MTIRLYPSRLQGEPLETHEHGEMTLHQWMSCNVKSYSERESHPIVAEIDGITASPEAWAHCTIHPDSDVRLYPVPFDPVTLGWIAVGVAVASAAYSIYMMSTMDKGGGYASANGLGLDLNPAKANTAKLGDPIRELFGRARVYPDYVVQPVSRFNPDDPTRMTVEMLICVSRGNVAFTNGDIRIGSTPISALGDSFSWTLYPPGADVSGDRRSENWFNSTEVGGTSSGSGLDMAQTAPDSSDITADSMTVSGASVSFNGLSDDDGDDSLPESWVEGALVTIIAPTNYLISSSSGYSVLFSDTLTEINPYAGMPVTLEINGAEYDLFIATFTPKQDAVPGVGGSAASLRGSAAPTTYDFSTSSQTFTLTWQATTYTVSLIANYGNMSGLLAAINEAIAGSNLVAQDDGGVVRIIEKSSPWLGGSITASSLPVSVFGDSPVFTDGTASSGGSPAITANVTLAYGSAGGAAFSGIPEGT
ncbi:phage tail protein, partial [Klebsiella aerogenes]